MRKNDLGREGSCVFVAPFSIKTILDNRQKKVEKMLDIRGAFREGGGGGCFAFVALFGFKITIDHLLDIMFAS